MRIVVAITGASGCVYGVQFVRELIKVYNENKNVLDEIHLIISNAAKIVLNAELSEEDKSFIFGPMVSSIVRVWSEEQIDASISSGSSKMEAMVIIPCSMKTVASIACGYANNLICRTADVMLKEGRKLILVPRETPVSTIHLKNMLKLSCNRVVILPASPAFYNKPKTIDDMVLFIVGKVLDQLGLENHLYRRWK